MDRRALPPLARHAAQLLAADPAGLGGAVLRGAPGPLRDAWLDEVRAALPAGTPWRRVLPSIAEERLLGGIDLAATLAAGRPVRERGLLAEAAGGVVLVAGSERLQDGPAAILGAALDHDIDEAPGRPPGRIAAVLLDEGIDDERTPSRLAERVAFLIDPHELSDDEPERPVARRDPAADLECAAVTIGDEAVEALCAAGLAFGVPSLRTATFAVRAAKAAAALAGRTRVDADDVALAAALVIAPRATTMPAAAPDEGHDDAVPPTDDDAEDEAVEDAAPDDDAGDDPTHSEALTDSVVEATRAAIPAGLLAALSAAAAPGGRSVPGGGAGKTRRPPARGRPAGTRCGMPGAGARLALVETLRAAAPWQRLRRQALPSGSRSVLVRRDDFRLVRFKARSEAVTIFVVDASGSAALHRLAEAKGAVELVLAECYVRRDQVALIAFRGSTAELLLPPTRSLARAKRALAGQVGGGATPLAAAIEAATRLADGIRRKGQTAMVVLMTDGRANIDRDGRPGRAKADADATLAARALRGSGAPCLLVDVAPRPSEPAQKLAAAMGARYVPLPHADSQTLSRAVLAAGPNR